jgi:hypothetical protein
MGFLIGSPPYVAMVYSNSLITYLSSKAFALLIDGENLSPYGVHDVVSSNDRITTTKRDKLINVLLFIVSYMIICYKS